MHTCAKSEHHLNENKVFMTDACTGEVAPGQTQVVQRELPGRPPLVEVVRRQVAGGTAAVAEQMLDSSVDDKRGAVLRERMQPRAVPITGRPHCLLR